jgi:deoxyribonuclease IV
MSSSLRAALGDRLIGPHLPLGQGLAKAARRAAEIGASTVQVFTDNPTAWRRRPEPPDKLPEFRELLSEAGVSPIAVHGPYLVNLAGGDDTFWQRSVATLIADLQLGAAYGARFLNVHVGSHRGLERDQGVRRLAEGVASVLANVPATLADGGASPMLVLENSTGSGDGLGSKLEELAEILAATEAAGADLDRVGICLDTAHLWAAGHRIDTPEAVEELADRADELLGDRLVMLHLNDARTACGSRVDRHEHIGAGQIGPLAIRALLEHPLLARLPTYLETPGMDLGYDAVNMDRIRLLLAGEALPALPPEAFEVRGSRSRSAPPGSAAS